MTKISRDRAERIARAHACVNCGEYSYKKLLMKPATEANHAEFKEEWHATKICGICDLYQELGIDEDGEVVYVT